MGQTIQVTRIAGQLATATDLVYSPDDGGYYFSQADFANNRARTSGDHIYSSREAALKDWNAHTVNWEPWR